MKQRSAEPVDVSTDTTVPWWARGPVLVGVLGALAIGSTLFLHAVGDQERQLHAASDELWNVRQQVATFHSELDERVGGPPLEESGDVWSSLGNAEESLRGILEGGTDLYGYRRMGLRDESQRERVRGLGPRLRELEAAGESLIKRRRDGEPVGLRDERFHDTYATFLEEVKRIEDSFHRKLMKLHIRSRISFAGVLTAWGVIIVVAVAGLRRFGVLHRKAERDRAALASFPKLNPSPIMEVDLEGHVHYRNPASRKIPELQDLSPSHPFLVGVKELGVALERGSQENCVREVKIKDAWYEQNLHHVKETGRVRIYAWDITERKRMDQALRESERQYRQLFEVAQEGIWVIDRDDRTTLVNASMARMLGYSPEEMIGLPVFSFMDEQGVSVCRENIERRRQGIREQHDFELLRKDGTRLYVTMEAAPIFDQNGGYAGSIAGVIDVSERKKNEDALREAQAELEERVLARTAALRKVNEELEQEVVDRRAAEALLSESKEQYKRLFREFNALLDAIQEPLLLLSPKMQVLWGNEAAISGLLPDRSGFSEFLCHELLHGRSEPCDVCPALTALTTGKAEMARVDTAEGRILELRAYPVPAEKGEPFNVILTVSDVTETSKFQADALRTAHLASLGEMAAGVAHEINNPINGIINYSQILANLSPDGSEEHDLARRIIKEGDRVAVIVRSLLSFARDRAEGKGDLHVGDIFRDALALVSAQLRKDGIVLSVDVPDDLPAVRAHPQQIQQVFLNILNNGRYALNQKYAGADENKKLQIIGRVHGAGPERYVRVVIVDYGVGISESMLKAVLNPFFTTKPRGQGTGLGLSISHGIITNHGGRLIVESSEGVFTRVIVDLPTAAAGSGRGAGA